MSQPDYNPGVVTLFIPGDSRLHKLHPFNRLVYILLTGVAVYLPAGGDLIACLFIAVNILLALTAGILGPLWRLMWRTLLPLCLFMIPIHGFLHPDNCTVLFSLGWTDFYIEGLRFALGVLLKLTAILGGSLLFVFCTHPVDLITAITQAGLSQATAYLIGSPLLLLPVIRGRLTTIQAAQHSRGLRSGGNFVVRFLALFPLLAPLVLSSLVEIEQRSIALEMKNFNSPGPKTSLREVHDSPMQRLLRWSMLAVSTAIIIHPLWN